mmetsp:Transcript_68345/g.160223  ORF Transcript_68345/g.160223 Transcript_68345/m.160223 type:complete len:235 (-) Transcript_68345:329-1033(-)
MLASPVHKALAISLHHSHLSGHHGLPNEDHTFDEVLLRPAGRPVHAAQPSLNNPLPRGLQEGTQLGGAAQLAQLQIERSHFALVRSTLLLSRGSRAGKAGRRCFRCRRHEALRRLGDIAGPNRRIQRNLVCRPLRLAGFVGRGDLNGENALRPKLRHLLEVLFGHDIRCEVLDGHEAAQLLAVVRLEHRDGERFAVRRVEGRNNVPADRRTLACHRCSPAELELPLARDCAKCL